MLSARYDVRSELFDAYAPHGILAIPPPVSNSPRRIEWEVAGLRLQLLAVTEAARQYQQDPCDFPGTLPNRIEPLRTVTKEGAEVAWESLVIGLA
jgi:hypothetical protein